MSTDDEDPYCRLPTVMTFYHDIGISLQNDDKDYYHIYFYSNIYWSVKCGQILLIFSKISKNIFFLNRAQMR